MKKRYRDKALLGLFASLQSADFDERENALFQAALLLMLANPAASDALPADDQESLPRELRRLRLGAAEQQQIVDRLALVIARQPESRATAFWALGAASAHAGLASVVSLLHAWGAQLDDEAACQACRALWRWLAEEGGQAGGQLADIGALLAAWAGSRDGRLRREARALLDGQGFANRRDHRERRVNRSDPK